MILYGIQPIPFGEIKRTLEKYLRGKANWCSDETGPQEHCRTLLVNYTAICIFDSMQSSCEGCWFPSSKFLDYVASFATCHECPIWKVDPLPIVNAAFAVLIDRGLVAEGAPQMYRLTGAKEEAVRYHAKDLWYCAELSYWAIMKNFNDTWGRP
jgi:hypothetical protein